MSTGEDNDDLVDKLVEADYIKTALVEKVFRAVDRADYYLPDQRESAYKDLAWKHEHLHMSAPCIYSEVMEALQLEPGLSFLNLGSGTGYLSTMVGLILGPYGKNHGVEQYQDVVDYANERLAEFKKTNSSFDEFDFCEPQLMVGNCLLLNSGWQLYDRVYVGAACPPEHEGYMKNLIKVGGVLVMPLNERLIQAKRTGETEWEVKNILPVSFATLVVPPRDNPPDFIDLPETPLPLLQELCRTTIRRILRTNIHKLHPGLSKVRKCVKKKRRRTNRLSNLNIVPLSMGMMILRHFDNEQDEDESDESETEGRERGAPDGASVPDRARVETNEEMENDEQDKNLQMVKDQAKDDNLAVSMEKGDGVEAQTNGKKRRSEDIDSTEAATGKLRGKYENGLNRRRQRNQDEASMAVDNDGESSKTNIIKTVGDIKPETSKPSELEDIAMAGESNCDKDKNIGSKSDDSESDYGSGDDLPEADDRTDRGSERANTGLDIERILALNIQKVRERITTELGALGPHDTDEDPEINPPDAPSFDTDDDDDMQVDFLESLKHRARSSCPPRKLRYSSNTSVDTSTTSGIGSYTDDHLDAEMASHMDSQKTSPGAVSMDGPELSKLRSRQQQMDYSDSEEGEEESDDKEGDSIPKESLGKLLRESVESLPLPTALRSYVMYYRN